MPTTAPRSVRLPATLVLVFTLPGCGGNKPSTASSEAPAAATATNPAADKPALPAPKPEIAALSFLQGSWLCVNPNKTVNREVWSSPAGSVVTGAFHQLRRDGSAGFYELSTIVAEADGVRLYHRHLHRQLTIDDKRKDNDVFTLVSLEPGKAVFAPVPGSPGASEEGIETMTYRLESPDVLLQELVFKPTSKEKNFTSHYTRE